MSKLISTWQNTACSDLFLWSRRWGKTKILSGKQLNFWIQSLCAKVSELVQLKYFLTEQIKMTFSTDLLLCPFFPLFSQLYPTSFCFSPNDLCSLHGTKCLLLTAFLFQSLSAWVTFLPKGVVLGFYRFACTPN